MPCVICKRTVYEFLSGKIVRKDPTRLVLEVGGIGFELLIPLSTFHSLGRPGEEVKILTHFQVREDNQQLFGFRTKEERDLFRLLLSVTGIGAKTALTVLSGIGIAELRRAIVEGSIPVLTSISGIGRKTAERLIVELREKVLLLETGVERGGLAPLPAGEQFIEDSIQALVSLGYRQPDAKRAIQKVLVEKGGSTTSVEDLIRASLKHI